jgi:hypothetical protein
VLKRIVRTIHEAIHIPELWPMALEEMSVMFDARSVAVMDGEVQSRCIVIGLQDEYIETWVPLFRRFRANHPTIFDFPIGSVLTNEDILTDEEFLASELYREWCEPQGIRYVMVGKVTENTVLRFLRGEGRGQFDAWDIRHCQYLLEQVIVSPDQGRLLTTTNH